MKSNSVAVKQDLKLNPGSSKADSAKESTALCLIWGIKKHSESIIPLLHILGK